MIGFYRTPYNTYPSSTNVRAQMKFKKKVKKALLMMTIIENALMIVIFLEISQTLDLL